MPMDVGQRLLHDPENCSFHMRRQPLQVRVDPQFNHKALLLKIPTALFLRAKRKPASSSRGGCSRWDTVRSSCDKESNNLSESSRPSTRVPCGSGICCVKDSNFHFSATSH